MISSDRGAAMLSTWTRPNGTRAWQTFRGSLPICAETDRDTALRYLRGMTDPHLCFDAQLNTYAPETVWDGDAGSFVPYVKIAGTL